MLLVFHEIHYYPVDKYLNRLCHSYHSAKHRKYFTRLRNSKHMFEKRWFRLGVNFSRWEITTRIFVVYGDSEIWNHWFISWQNGFNFRVRFRTSIHYVRDRRRKNCRAIGVENLSNSEPISIECCKEGIFIRWKVAWKNLFLNSVFA